MRDQLGDAPNWAKLTARGYPDRTGYHAATTHGCSPTSCRTSASRRCCPRCRTAARCGPASSRDFFKSHAMFLSSGNPEHHWWASLSLKRPATSGWPRCLIGVDSWSTTGIASLPKTWTEGVKAIGVRILRTPVRAPKAKLNEFLTLVESLNNSCRTRPVHLGVNRPVTIQVQR